MVRNVYVAIMRAAKCGVGLRLTADECHALSLDDGIAQPAANAEYEPATTSAVDGLTRLGPKLKRAARRRVCSHPCVGDKSPRGASRDSWRGECEHLITERTTAVFKPEER